MVRMMSLSHYDHTSIQAYNDTQAYNDEIPFMLIYIVFVELTIPGGLENTTPPHSLEVIFTRRFTYTEVVVVS